MSQSHLLSFDLHRRKPYLLRFFFFTLFFILFIIIFYNLTHMPSDIFFTLTGKTYVEEYANFYMNPLLKYVEIIHISA